MHGRLAGIHLLEAFLSQALPLLRLDKAELRKPCYAEQSLLWVVGGMGASRPDPPACFAFPPISGLGMLYGKASCVDLATESSQIIRRRPNLCPPVSGPLRGEDSAGGLRAAGGGGLQIFPAGSAPWQPPNAGIPPCPPSGSQDFQERHWPPASLGPRRSGRSRLENSEQILNMLGWKSGQGWKSQSTALFPFWAWPGRKDEGFPRADGILANGSPVQLTFAFSHPTDLLGAKSQPVGTTPLGPDP